VLLGPTSARNALLPLAAVGRASGGKSETSVADRTDTQGEASGLPSTIRIASVATDVSLLPPEARRRRPTATTHFLRWWSRAAHGQSVLGAPGRAPLYRASLLRAQKDQRGVFDMALSGIVRLERSK